MPPRRRSSVLSDSDTPRRAIGAVLRRWRTDKGLRQDQLATAIGLPAGSFISQIETGHRRVPAELYRQYAGALGIDARAFAKVLMQYYDPCLYRILFGSEGAGATGMIEAAVERDDKPSRAV